MKKCIICLQTNTMSEEHIIPLFLGGKLTINNVCAPCNNRMGHSFEIKLANSFLFKTPAYINGIVTRSGKTSFPLARTYNVDGKKVRINNDGSFSFASSNIDITETGTGISVNALIPMEQAPNHKKIIAKALDRQLPRLKSLNQPDKAELIEDITRNLTCSPVYSGTISITTKQPIYINDFSLLFIKVAYEFATYKFGNKYINLNEVSLLRQTLMQCDNVPAGLAWPFEKITCIEDLIDNEHHWIVICEHVMYIKLFSITYVVIYAPNYFNQKEDHIYFRFCYKTGAMKEYKESELLTTKKNRA